MKRVHVKLYIVLYRFLALRFSKSCFQIQGKPIISLVEFTHKMHYNFYASPLLNLNFSCSCNCIQNGETFAYTADQSSSY